MKIAITWTSQNLYDLLSPTQITEMVTTKNRIPKIQLIIQNLAFAGNPAVAISVEPIYIAFWRPAVVWECIRIWLGEVLSFEDVTLEDTNIVSETVANNIIIETN